MLVLELPFVSQRLSGINHAPQEARTSQEIADAMARHGMSSATFIGHSLGTVYLAWLARLQPQLLASCVFIDPIGTRATRPPEMCTNVVGLLNILLGPNMRHACRT